MAAVSVNIDQATCLCSGEGALLYPGDHRASSATGFACDNWRMQLSHELHEPHVPQLLGPDHRVVKISVCILFHGGVHRHRQPQPCTTGCLLAAGRII